VLVIVEDGNLHPLPQLLLNIEALGGLDVFQVDTAEGGLQAGDGLDEQVRVGLLNFQVEDVNVGEFLEQHSLAFHHRLGRQRPDVAQAQHGGAIGDDPHQIGPGSHGGHLRRVGDNFLAGRRHPGGIGQGQIILVGQLFGGLDRDFPRMGLAVISQRRLAQLVFFHGGIHYIK